MMRKEKMRIFTVALLGILSMALVVGCSPNDPIPGSLYTQDVYPGTNTTYDLGSLELQYQNIYTSDLFVAGNFSVNNLLPDADSTYDVGAPGNEFAEGYFDTLYVGGVKLSLSSYGEFYITAPIATVCTLAGTFYKVEGTTTADELRGFSHGNGRLTYIGEGSRVFLVDVAMSVSSDRVNVVLSTKAYVNGVPHEASLIQRKIAVAGDIGAQPLTTLLILGTGDYIEIYIASDRAGAEITFTGMSLTVTSVD